MLLLVSSGGQKGVNPTISSLIYLICHMFSHYCSPNIQDYLGGFAMLLSSQQNDTA